MNASRPNILFVFTDEQWAGAMRCAGNHELHTPNMDRLAREGVRFTHACCAQPLCIPSRASMMTGVMPHTHGVTTNRSERSVPEFVAGARDGSWPLMGRLFSDGGYTTGYFGKWHLPVDPKDEESHGFGRVVLDRDWELPRSFARFLNERNGPFASVVSFMNPHNICEWARGSSLPDASLPPPPPADECPALPANFEPPEGEPGWIREFQRRRAWNYIAPGYDEGQWRQYRWAYWRLCEEVDRQLGNLMAALRMYDLDSDTLVVFSSDHGDGLAAHRWTQKQVFYEEPVRVPLIVRPPRCASSFEDDRLVNSGTQILPTLLDYAGLEVPPGIQGGSLRPAVEGRDTEKPEYVVTETDFCGGGERWGAGGRMVRTDRYKYCVYSPLREGDTTEQFFDLQEDPGEMANLIGRPDFEEEVERHRRLLLMWQDSTGDDWTP